MSKKICRMNNVMNHENRNSTTDRASYFVFRRCLHSFALGTDSILLGGVVYEAEEFWKLYLS